MQFAGRLILKGWEASKNPGFTQGYLKVYDVGSKTDFQMGTTFVMDDATIDRAPQNYVADGFLRDGKYGMNMTITNIQIVPDKQRT